MNPETSNSYLTAARLGNPRYFAQRETGCFPRYYRQDFEAKKTLYSRFLNVNQYPGKDFNAQYGGVFGLDFSSDG